MKKDMEEEMRMDEKERDESDKEKEMVIICSSYFRL
jgi:hypothetical protein